MFISQFGRSKDMNQFATCSRLAMKAVTQKTVGNLRLAVVPMQGPLMESQEKRAVSNIGQEEL